MIKNTLSYRSLFNLRGKTAIVTGGAGILGRHFAAGLAEFGANVVIVDLDEKICRKFAEELTARYGVKTLGIGCDISKPAAVAGMLKKTIQKFGSVEILHNNAATKTSDTAAFFEPTEKYSLKTWRQVMEVNIDAMFLMAQAVGKQMIRQKKGGSIIQTASIYGLMAPDQRIYEGSFYLGRKINTPLVYTTSKAAVLGLTKHLAALWAPHGIRVNVIVPGGVRSGQNKIFEKKYSARIPMGRMARAPEMVGALIYLAGDASSYVTGQVLAVDGGLSAW